MKEQNRDRFDSFLKRNRSRLGQVIHVLWDSKDEALWTKDPYYFLRLGERADTLGQSMFAHDILREGLRVFPGHLLITQRYCLSLIKCGFLLTAKDLLTRLMKDGHYDEETLGILGRVYKEMWLIEGEGAPEHPHLAKSRELYLGAFRRSRGYYSGINAASLSLIMGDKDLSRRVARQVLRICADLLKDPSQRGYWIMATVAEAFVLLGRQERAAKFYRLARARSVRNYSNLASTRRQLFAPGALYPGRPERAGDLAGPPGYRLHRPHDRRPGPGEPPFPAVLSRSCEAADCVASFEAEREHRLRLRCLRSRHPVSRMPPCPRGRKQRCASFRQGGLLRDQRELRRSRVEETRAGCPCKRLDGRASHPGGISQRRRDPVLLRKPAHHGQGHPPQSFPGDRAAPGCGVGRKAQREAGRNIGVRHVVGADRLPVCRHQSADRQGAITWRKGTGFLGGRSSTTRGPGKGRQTVAILFADMVGYSKLSEEQVPAYVKGFLTGVSRTLRASGAEPLYKNTWGDAICLAFDDPLMAAECAISLRDMVRKTDWARSQPARDPERQDRAPRGARVLRPGAAPGPAERLRLSREPGRAHRAHHKPRERLRQRIFCRASAH